MKISIIIPAFNEEKYIKNTIDIITQYMNLHYKNRWELIIIDDCSHDNTYNLVLSYIHSINPKKRDIIKLFYNIKNQGKGYSIMRGLNESEGDYIITLDADMSTDINQLPKLLIYKDKYDIILGSRYLKSSIIKKRQSLIRIFYSRCYNIIIRILFNLKYKDTQNGFTLYTDESKYMILNNSYINRFSYNIEHIIIAKKHGLKVKEVPIIWSDNKPNKVRFKQIKEMFIDLIRIKRYERLGLYN